MVNLLVAAAVFRLLRSKHVYRPGEHILFIAMFPGLIVLAACLSKGVACSLTAGFTVLTNVRRWLFVALIKCARVRSSLDHLEYRP